MPESRPRTRGTSATSAAATRACPGHECQLREYQHNLAKYLEYALNDGVDVLTGQVRGARTGDAAGFATFDDVLAALHKQIEFGIETVAAELDAVWTDRLAETPFHFESLLVEGCVEQALDLNVGARYVHHIQHAGAIATVADSLAAIRGAVFEDGVLSLAELRDVLRADFAGQELLRLRLQSRYPKFGNDDDSVDALATLATTWFCDGDPAPSGRPVWRLVAPTLHLPPLQANGQGDRRYRRRSPRRPAR